jgi:hypothetical protein
MTLAERMDELERSIIKVQITIADHLTPALRECTFRLGVMSLRWYLAMPWYRRTWHDLRTGRAWRNVRDGLLSLRHDGSQDG